MQLNIYSLSAMINRGYYTHIPVGYHGNVAFRLLPTTELLSPTERTNKQMNGILGFIKNMVSSSDHESRAENTRLNDKSGFAFMQLGALQCTYGLGEEVTSKDPDKVTALKWVDAGFVLAVVIDSSNRAGDVYALSNICSRDPEAGERTRAVDRDYLPGEVSNAKPKRRAAIRIAQSFAMLDADFALQLPDPIFSPEHEMENDERRV